MDKPVTLSVKEWLIRNMSVKSNVPERIIESVINHQMNSAYDALTHCDSLEFSGFGKFYFNRKKAKYRMEKFMSQKEAFERIIMDETVSPQKRHSAELKLLTALQNIDALKPKMNEQDR